jgi:multisubunit Na+/H+ antiporter MnhG subunit
MSSTWCCSVQWQRRAPLEAEAKASDSRREAARARARSSWRTRRRHVLAQKRGTHRQHANMNEGGGSRLAFDSITMRVTYVRPRPTVQYFQSSSVYARRQEPIRPTRLHESTRMATVGSGMPIACPGIAATRCRQRVRAFAVTSTLTAAMTTAPVLSAPEMGQETARQSNYRQLSGQSTTAVDAWLEFEAQAAVRAAHRTRQSAQTAH